VKALALVLLLSVLALAQVEGELLKESWSCDLDGDKQAETMTLRAYRVEEGNYFATLVVLGADGKVLWESEKVAEATDPMAFGAWDFGVSLPEVVGDIDRDKQIELVAPAPISDVRPVEFKVYRWLDGTFRPAYTRALLLGKDNRFRWTTPKEGNQTWVARFEGWQSDKLVAGVTSTVGKTGKVLLAPEKGGFIVVRWLSPLR
jgi:hypothetical protein